MMLADATNEQAEVLIFAGAVVTGFVATLVSVAANFATRQELEDLRKSVARIEAKLGTAGEETNKESRNL